MRQISERVQLLNDKKENKSAKYVLYWMQVYKRVHDNHALDFAIEKANELNLPLVVYEGLKFYYPWASDRIHTFILEGVEQKRVEFKNLGATYVFYLQTDKDAPKQTVKKLAAKAALIVTDDFPCFIIPGHNKAIAEKTEIPVYTVDSNGIIPMSKFEKEQYAAYTIRPKIKRLLDEYFVPLTIRKIKNRQSNVPVDCPDTEVIPQNLSMLVSNCSIDHSVKPSRSYPGGTENGRLRLQKFIRDILPEYHRMRNKPEIDGTSRLSPYLHFGFLSSLEIGLAVKNSRAPDEAKDAFLEELIVRRELSYNFTRFNQKYDSIDSLPDWVRQTMREHIADERSYLYSIEELEESRTHDELWNAAQREMVKTGGMHNYIRMLWGKNIIAWTKNYEEAFAFMEHLNNKYCLDGRDPNSYAGILWCFGKHDRAWMERPVFGKIRYMTSKSTGKKFDSKKYIEWTKRLGEGSEE